MAVALTVIKSDLEHLSVRLNVTGLTVGTKYDMYRLQVRYEGDNDLGNPVYSREIPDRKALWSTIAHRVGWTAPAATVDVTDYETPLRPSQYFVVPTASVAPHEYTTWDTPYPVSRGTLSPTVVHFSRDLDKAMSNGPQIPGHILVRSTAELGKFITCCVVDLDELKFTARGTELAVMGSQYPTYVADSREARRGSIILKIDSLAQFNDIRSIVFPPTGAIRPIVFNAGSEPTMLLDDMRAIPLDVTVEQITHSDPSLRYLHIDFVEVDPTTPLVQRSGDNDSLTNKPNANFSISDKNPNRNQWITLTDTSTGQYDSWSWSVGRGTNNKMGKFHSQGPHRLRFSARGEHQIKLRVWGSIAGNAGADTVTKTVTVH